MSGRILLLTLLIGVPMLSATTVSAQQDPCTLVDQAMAASDRADSPEALEKAAALPAEACKANRVPLLDKPLSLCQKCEKRHARTPGRGPM